MHCDDPDYAAERLFSYLHPPLYVAGEVDRGVPFDSVAAAEPALFRVPRASDAHSADDGQGCESSADGSAADYDDYGAYYDPQYSAGWQANDDVEHDAGEACYDDGQWEQDWQAHDRAADTEWHAGHGYYGHDPADGSYIAGDPVLADDSNAGWHSGDARVDNAAFDGDADGAGLDFDSSTEYDADQPHAHASHCGHGMQSDIQLSMYSKNISGTYGHVHDPACQPSTGYYDPGGYGENGYGADDCSTTGGYDGGADYGYSRDGCSGGCNNGGYDGGDYGDDY